jgi:hypothetical protein
MQNVVALREKLFTMRMSAEEWARAEKLAEHDGLTVAALVRMLLKDRERHLERSEPSAKPKASRRK